MHTHTHIYINKYIYIYISSSLVVDFFGENLLDDVLEGDDADARTRTCWPLPPGTIPVGVRTWIAYQ